MRALARHLPLAAIALSVFGVAHIADRMAYGLAMQQRGLGPAQSSDWGR
jgi:hypothetical protein